MNSPNDANDPIEMLRSDRTPNHGADFWESLEIQLGNEVAAQGRASNRQGTPGQTNEPLLASSAPSAAGNVVSLADWRRPTMLAAAAALLVVALVGGVFALNRSDESSQDRTVIADEGSGGGEGSDGTQVPEPQPEREVLPLATPTPGPADFPVAVPTPIGTPSPEDPPGAVIAPTPPPPAIERVPDTAALLAVGPTGITYYGEPIASTAGNCPTGFSRILAENPLQAGTIFDAFPRPELVGRIDQLDLNVNGYAFITTTCDGFQELYMGRFQPDTGILAGFRNGPVDFGGPVSLRNAGVLFDADIVFVEVQAENTVGFVSVELPFGATGTAPSTLPTEADTEVGAVPEGARMLATGPDGSNYWGVDQPSTSGACGQPTTSLLGQDPFEPDLLFDPFPRADSVGFIEALEVSANSWALIARNCNGTQSVYMGGMGDFGVLADSMEEAIGFAPATLFRNLSLGPDRLIVEAVSLDLATGEQVGAYQPYEVPFATRTPSPAQIEPGPDPAGGLPNNARMVGDVPGTGYTYHAFEEPGDCGTPGVGQLRVVGQDGLVRSGFDGPTPLAAPVRELVVDPTTRFAVIVASCAVGDRSVLQPVVIDADGLLGAIQPIDSSFPLTADLQEFGWSQDLTVQWSGTNVRISNSFGGVANIDVPDGLITIEGEFLGGPIAGPSAPAGLYPVSAGESLDGLLEYWMAEHPLGETGCEGASQTLWVHDTASDIWDPAFLDQAALPTDIATGLAHSPFDETAVISFGCEGFGASVTVAERTGDGRFFAVNSYPIPNIDFGAVTALEWLSPGMVVVEVDVFDGSDPTVYTLDTFNGVFV